MRSIVIAIVAALSSGACGSIPKSADLSLDGRSQDGVVVGGVAVLALPDGILGLTAGALYSGINLRWENETDPTAAAILFSREHGSLCVTFDEPPCDMRQAVYNAVSAAPGVYRLTGAYAVGPGGGDWTFEYPEKPIPLFHQFEGLPGRVAYMGDVHWAPHEGVVSSEFGIFRGASSKASPHGVVRVRTAADAAALWENFTNVVGQPVYTRQVLSVEEEFARLSR